MYEILYGIEKWSHYLGGRHNNPNQHTWSTKLMGFDYKIRYKKGKENVGADALSRLTSAELLLMATFSISADLFREIQLSCETDPYLHQFIQSLQDSNSTPSKYTWQQSELRRKGKPNHTCGIEWVCPPNHGMELVLRSTFGNG